MSIQLSLIRHDKKMIEKLERAGLGFCVRASETTQRLGIPEIYIRYYYNIIPHLS